MGCKRGKPAGLNQDVAGATDARFVVFGELVRVDASLMFTAMLYDSELASSRGRVVRRGPNVEALIEALPGAVGELVGPTVFGLPQGTTSRVLVLDVRPRPPGLPPPPPSSRRRRWASRVIPRC